jgi:predicted flap endonuclease-1-like 5' DNA nuclease
MNVPAALVLGLLIGWLIEWILDWFYWRARMRQLVEENPDLEEESTHLKERVAELEDEISRIKASAMVAHLLNKDGTHNFQAIKGIGPAFSKRLIAAGIRTFEQLAQLTSEDTEKILGTLYKRFFSKENMILTQAREFANHIAASQGKRKA